MLMGCLRILRVETLTGKRNLPVTWGVDHDSARIQPLSGSGNRHDHTSSHDAERRISYRSNEGERLPTHTHEHTVDLDLDTHL